MFDTIILKNTDTHARIEVWHDGQCCGDLHVKNDVARCFLGALEPRPNATYCPQNIIGDLHDYVQHGLLGNSFLRACLENDLKGATALASVRDSMSLRHVMAYLRWNIPGETWGSKEDVAKHIAAKKAERLESHA